MLRQQAGRFLIVGFVAVLVDSLVYIILKFHMTPSYAKGVSFLCGTLVAYLLNKGWTFEENKHQPGKIARFVTLYLFTLCANVAVNKVSLAIIPQAYVFALLAATGTSTVLNFIGQKWWVFKQ